MADSHVRLRTNSGHGEVSVRLLGEVRVRRGGEDHFLGSGRRAAVLAVLALDSSVSRQQLVAAVWGGDPPASANGNLYTYVTGLRQVLGDGILMHADGVYSLRVPGQQVDAVWFEALRKQAQRHRATGDLLAEVAALQEGLSLWDGEALAGLPGPFAETRRARLHELRLASQQRHAEALLELGRSDAAITALAPLVTAHPMHESLHRLLMIALHAAGRRDEALNIYDRLTAFLIQETGTEPAAELRQTRERIANDSESLE